MNNSISGSAEANFDVASAHIRQIQSTTLQRVNQILDLVSFIYILKDLKVQKNTHTSAKRVYF